MKQCYKIILAGDGDRKINVIKYQNERKIHRFPQDYDRRQIHVPLEYHINGINYTLMVWDLGGQTFSIYA